MTVGSEDVSDSYCTWLPQTYQQQETAGYPRHGLRMQNTCYSICSHETQTSITLPVILPALSKQFLTR